MGLGMVGLLLAGVMFPLWPPFMRQGVWYLSIGLLGLVGAFFVLAIIRLILWGFSKVIGKPFWLFPNLFADVGFVSVRSCVYSASVFDTDKVSRIPTGGLVYSSLGVGCSAAPKEVAQGTPHRAKTATTTATEKQRTRRRHRGAGVAIGRAGEQARCCSTGRV